MNKKALLAAAMAGLFAIPAFAKGPTKTSPANQKVCLDADGKTIPCEEPKKAEDPKSANGCGANGCGAAHTPPAKK